jgi:hypothetical protein
LQSSVEWSHGHERSSSFRRLAVFSGGFTLAAAEVIADDEPPRAAAGSSHGWSTSLIIAEAMGPPPSVT